MWNISNTKEVCNFFVLLNLEHRIKNILFCILLLPFFISLQREHQCIWTKQFHSVGHIAQSILSHFQWPGKHEGCCAGKKNLKKKKIKDKRGKKEREKPNSPTKLYTNSTFIININLKPISFLGESDYQGNESMVLCLTMVSFGKCWETTAIMNLKSNICVTVITK